jgi:hypothetical protein
MVRVGSIWQYSRFQNAFEESRLNLEDIKRNQILIVVNLDGTMNLPKAKDETRETR